MWCGPLWEDTCSTRQPQSALWKPRNWVGDRGESIRVRPGFGLEGRNYYSSPRVAFGLANCSMKWAPGTVQTPRNRPLTVSQQCSLCVKIVKAGPFLHWSSLSFEPQLWANKAGSKVCMMVSKVAVAALVFVSVRAAEYVFFVLQVGLQRLMKDVKYI